MRLNVIKPQWAGLLFKYKLCNRVDELERVRNVLYNMQVYW